MKIELATIVASKQEIPWLDFGLESILDTTKHDINTTIYLARYTDEMFEDCAKLANNIMLILSPGAITLPSNTLMKLSIEDLIFIMQTVL